MRIKKLLMLVDPYADHLAYMMYDGLYRVLGKDNVYIYPFVKYFIGEIHEWREDNKRQFTIPLSYGRRHEYQQKTFEEFINIINEFDIIYLSSPRTYAVRALDQFISYFGRNNLPPLVLSEGEDGSSLYYIENIKKLYNPIVYFKRDLLQSDIEKRKDLYPIYSLPFSTAIDNTAIDHNFQDNPNKDIDICVQFGDSHPIRENIIKSLLANNIQNRYNAHITINSFQFDPQKIDIFSRMGVLIPYMPYNFYMNIMSRSKINIIARGHGFDTVRRFEALYYSGLVLSDNIPIMTPDPFIDKTHIVYYKDDLSDLIPLIDYYLSHEEERKIIGKNGKEHCDRYHTTEARAKYFLDRIEQHL